jgi:valacyclovir hydrolase
MSWFKHGTSRIYYEESGQGDPILLLPGFSESISDHAELRDRVSKTYRVIAADLPGSGRSEPQPRDYPSSYYDDDAQALAALVAATTDRPTHLIGFSDGGEVALLIAALHPEVARSVLVWGAAGVVNDPGGAIRAAFHDVIDDPSPAMAAYSKRLIARYGAPNARAMTQSFSKALTAIVDAGGDISRSKAGKIVCPTLLIVGEHDHFAPKALAEQYAALVKEAKVFEVEGAGHTVHKDRPEWFVQTVVDWLSARS